MGSVSRSRRVPETRSGGKILRARPARSAKTPYDRPEPSNSNPQSPNWLSRFIFSPTRFIASGAGKLISSVLDLDSSPVSFSSSSSSSDGDSIEEEEIGTFNDENDIAHQGIDVLKKKELQPLVGNGNNKHLIEELLKKETYSREESDRLIKIIRSRVVDSFTNGDAGDKRPVIDVPDLCSAAVMEAKKWLEEKKSGSGSKSDLGYGSHSLNKVTLPQAFENEGSLVDVAKSYMRARPPWASPSIDHIKPPSPIGNKLFKEEIPYQFSGNSTSSSKLKWDSPATGSWSIQDEIRKVRSRATENMLRTLPASKIDWSELALEYKNNLNSSAMGNIGASMGEKVHNFTNSIDASLNLARGFGTQALPDFKRKEDKFQPEAVSSDPVEIDSEQNEGNEAIQQNKDVQDSCRDTTTSGQKLSLSNDLMTMVNSDGGVVVNGTDDNGPNHQLNLVEETREASDSKIQDGNCSVLKEKIEGDALANGLPSSGPSFVAEQDIDQNNNKSQNEHSIEGSGYERVAKVVLEQENREMLSETSMEVPDVNINESVTNNEDNGVATGSQNSSSLQYEVEPGHSLPGSEPDSAATPSSIAKRRGKRITKYNRRGRGRGVK